MKMSINIGQEYTYPARKHLENVKLEDRSFDAKVMLKYHTRETFILWDAMHTDLGRMED